MAIDRSAPIPGVELHLETIFKPLTCLSKVRRDSLPRCILAFLLPYEQQLKAPVSILRELSNSYRSDLIWLPISSRYVRGIAAEAGVSYQNTCWYVNKRQKTDGPPKLEDHSIVTALKSSGSRNRDDMAQLKYGSMSVCSAGGHLRASTCSLLPSLLAQPFTCL